MNETIDPQAIADAYEDDPIAAASEYGAEFRSDVESFVALETVLSAVDKGVYERPPRHGVSYRGFCDPSGGHADSYTLGVAHSEGDKIVLDLLREVRPPMSPEGVTADYADDLRRYGVHTVIADRWGASWVEERFSVEGIRCDHRPIRNRPSTLAFCRYSTAAASGFWIVRAWSRSSWAWNGVPHAAGAIRSITHPAAMTT